MTPTEAPTIDPRSPRFAATITSALLLAATILALTGISTATAATASFGWFAYQPLAEASFAFVVRPTAIESARITQRALDPGFILTLVIAALFLWGVVSPRTQPWSLLFRTLVRPRLAPSAELEDARPPRFAQGIGLLVVGIGLLLHLFGVPWALPIATAAAFLAAFLNAAFGYCLGCQIYLLLLRAGIIRQRPAAAA